MRVVLIKPHDTYGDAYQAAFGVRMPPLGLATLAAVLRENGHKVRIIDTNVSKLTDDELIDEIARFRSQLVGFTTIASTLYPHAARLARKIKSNFPDIVTVAGGHHITFTYPEALSEGIDFCVLGEGELTLLELVTRLESNGDTESIRGIAFMSSQGNVIRTPPRLPIRSLDVLPFPARDLLDNEKYTVDILEKGAKLATLETSRGCPYRCDFCTVPAMWGRRWRFKSNSRIIEELELLERAGFKYVFFVDDIFWIPSFEERKKQLFEEMIERGFQFRWLCQIRTDSVTGNPKLVKLAAKAGMVIAFLGIESGDERVLATIGKNVRPPMAEKAVQILDENGVMAYGGFILGSPGESIEQTRNTIQFAHDLGRKGMAVAQFTVYTPLPGSSSFYRSARNDRILTYDWSRFDCMHPVLRTSWLPWKLYLETKLAHYRFYIRRAFSSIRELNKTPKPYLNHATRFVMNRLPHYALGLIKLPFEMVDVFRYLKRPKSISSEPLRKILDSEGLDILGSMKKWTRVDEIGDLSLTQRQ